MKIEKNGVIDFGELVKEARIKEHKSLKVVADHLEISSVYLSDIENGRRNPLKEEQIISLAKYLNADVKSLVAAAKIKKKFLELDVQGKSEGIRSLAMGLARHWDNLSDQDAKELLEKIEMNGAKRK